MNPKSSDLAWINCAVLSVAALLGGTINAAFDTFQERAVAILIVLAVVLAGCLGWVVADNVRSHEAALRASAAIAKKRRLYEVDGSQADLDRQKQYRSRWCQCPLCETSGPESDR